MSAPVRRLVFPSLPVEVNQQLEAAAVALITAYENRQGVSAAQSALVALLVAYNLMPQLEAPQIGNIQRLDLNYLSMRADIAILLYAAAEQVIPPLPVYRHDNTRYARQAERRAQIDGLRDLALVELVAPFPLPPPPPSPSFIDWLLSGLDHQAILVRYRQAQLGDTEAWNVKVEREVRAQTAQLLADPRNAAARDQILLEERIQRRLRLEQHFNTKQNAVGESYDSDRRSIRRRNVAVAASVGLAFTAFVASRPTKH